MAQNCPYYRFAKCANPNGDHLHDCSWLRQDFDECTVYVLITDPARGMARILGGPLGGGSPSRTARGPTLPPAPEESPAVTPAPVPPGSGRVDLADLLGVASPRIHWRQWRFFLLAVCAGQVAALSLDALRFGWRSPRTWLAYALWAMLLVGAAGVAFRFVKRPLVACVAAALLHGAIHQPLRLALFGGEFRVETLPLAALSTFCLLGGAALGLRRSGQWWLGLAVGMAAGEIASFFSWRLWLALTERVPTHFTGAAISLLQVVVSGFVTAGVLWHLRWSIRMSPSSTGIGDTVPRSSRADWLLEANQLLRYRASSHAKPDAQIAFTEALLSREGAPRIRLVLFHSTDPQAEYPWLLLKAGTLQAIHSYAGDDDASDRAFASLFGSQPRSIIWADHIAENCPRSGEVVTPQGRRVYEQLAQDVRDGRYVVERVVRA